MKRTALLHREISALVARLGHLDEIVLCDAGLPTPAGVPVIDLAIVPGQVPLFDVLSALKHELVIEGAIWAHEASATLDTQFRACMDDWSAQTGQAIAVDHISHSAFKIRSTHARCILRTGEVTPYANVILVSGVAF